MPSAEAELVGRLTSKAVEAKLPVPVLKEIEKDARWSNTTKTGLIVGGPEVSAKWLNKLGVGAENRAEVIFGAAVASVVFSHMRLERRLEKLIQEAKGPQPGQPEEKK